MKISRRDKRFLIFGIVFGLTVLLVFYVVLPFHEAQTEIKTKLETTDRLLQQSIRVIQSEKTYLSQQVELERVLESYRAQLLDGNEGTMARVQLEEIVRNLAEEHGVTISRSNPVQERKVGERYAKITLQINVQSGMQELAQFLHALSTHAKFLKVEEFQINGFRARNQVIRLQPRMNVSGFIRLSEV